MVLGGPDGCGVYVNEELSLSFGHRRLFVIDLSDSSNQPFVLQNSRYYIVYNGELYNYRELRKELLSCGYTFSTESDTEWF